MQRSHDSFLLRAIAWLIILAACACSPAPQPTPRVGPPPVYNYPIQNPYAATIIGVPPGMKVDYSALPQPSDRTITLFPGRAIPEGFWYDDGLRYSQLLQPGPAPLVYIIGGTGADSRSSATMLLADILYSAGFSVVMLPSPTHPDFIINASEFFITGNATQDAKDLYRAMTAIDARLVRSGTNPGPRLLAGYSLGALNAAFVAQLDSTRHQMHFRKTLLINPPLSLYSSMKVIDHMLYRALPHGIDDADRFIKGFVARLASVSTSSDALDFQNERVLLDAYTTYKPSDDRLATTIGLSFRLAGANMIFTSDVMNHSGYIFPKDRPFTTSTPLEDYLDVALRTSFRQYFDEVFLPACTIRNPGLSKDEIIAQSSLETLRPFFAAHPEISLITNRDDIILAPGEPARLAALFEGRAVLFPTGGHLGNLGHPAVAARIVELLR